MVKIKSTYSLCPKCNEISKGEISKVGNKLKMTIICKEHGENIVDFFDDADFFIKIQQIIKNNKLLFEFKFDSDVLNVDNSEEIMTSIHINFTDRCNLKCKDCFAVCDPKSNNNVEEITLEEIKAGLKPYENKKHKPMVVIIGGEPTIRDDLPELIKYLSKKGYIVRLSTNGIKLLDESYMKLLYDNGLDWLLLQFDGFNANTSIDFRGVDLIKEKLKVIRNAQKIGLKIHLICMISKGINDSEIFKILEFGLAEKGIYAVNLYPVSLTGRFGENSTSAFDCIKFLEEQSKGTISEKDFIKTKKIWNTLYKFSHKPIFRQKICTYPLFFFKMRDNIYPINQLFKIMNFLKHPVFTIRYLFKSLKLIKWSNEPNDNFLYFNIEKFYHSGAMDLEDAYDCHNLYLTPQGFIPLCIYNALYRERSMC